MAHGQPDFAAQSPKVTVYGLTDMAELAVRLGSISIFDRRGDVIFMDDFELPNTHWDVASVGSENYTYPSTIESRSGCQSMRMRTGAVADQYTMFSRLFQLFVLSKVGLEVSFAIHGNGGNFSIEFSRYYGSLRYRAVCRYLSTTPALTILTPTGEQTIDTKELYLSTDAFHTMKLVADFPNDKYERLLVDDGEYDISAYDLATAFNSEAEHLGIYIRLDSLAAAATAVYVDDLILTQNEP